MDYKNQSSSKTVLIRKTGLTCNSQRKLSFDNCSTQLDSPLFDDTTREDIFPDTPSTKIDTEIDFRAHSLSISLTLPTSYTELVTLFQKENENLDDYEPNIASLFLSITEIFEAVAEKDKSSCYFLNAEYSFFTKSKELQLIVISKTAEDKQIGIPAFCKQLSMKKHAEFQSIKAVAVNKNKPETFYLLTAFTQKDMVWLNSSCFKQDSTLFFIANTIPVPSVNLIRVLNLFVTETFSKNFDFMLKINEKVDKLASYIDFDFSKYEFTKKFVITRDSNSSKVVCAKFVNKADHLDFVYWPESWVPSMIVDYWPSLQTNLETSELTWRRLNLYNFARTSGKTTDSIDASYRDSKMQNELVYSLRAYTGKVLSTQIKLIFNAKTWVSQIVAIHDYGVSRKKVMTNVTFGQVAEACRDGLIVFKLKGKIRTCCLCKGMQLGIQQFSEGDLLNWAFIYK